MGNANRHLTELERIQSAEEAAKEWLLANVPPERLEKLAWGQLVSDLTHMFLMSGPPSEELSRQLRERILAEVPPWKAALPRRKIKCFANKGDKKSWLAIRLRGRFWCC